jgi:copper(I)-binding protein
MRILRSLPILVAVLFAPAAVQAASADVLVVEGAWIRSAPPGSPVMAGYATLANPGSTEIVLDRIESQAFGAIEMHEMRELDGMMRMRPLPELRIEPDGKVALAPGATHLMLFRPARELAPGASVELVFVLDDGSQRAVAFEVRTPP